MFLNFRVWRETKKWTGPFFWCSPLGVMLNLTPADQNFDANDKKPDAALHVKLQIAFCCWLTIEAWNFSDQPWGFIQGKNLRRRSASASHFPRMITNGKFCSRQTKGKFRNNMFLCLCFGSWEWHYNILLAPLFVANIEGLGSWGPTWHFMTFTPVPSWGSMIHFLFDFWEVVFWQNPNNQTLQYKLVFKNWGRRQDN